MMLKIDEIIFYGRYYRDDEEKETNWWYCKVDGHIYHMSDLTSQFGYVSIDEVENNGNYIQLFRTDIIELKKRFINAIAKNRKLCNLPDSEFDIEFNKFIDQSSMHKEWFDYECAVLKQDAIEWCKQNNIPFM